MPLVPAAADCALLLVDLQVGSIASIRTLAPARLKDNAIGLATVTAMHGIPAVLTAGRRPGVGGVFLPELKGLLPGHAYVERSVVAAFDDVALRDAVLATGRKTLILAGIATDIGLLHAALGAKELGLCPIAVLDASGTTDRQAEMIAQARLIQQGITVAGWASIATGLMHDFNGRHSLDTQALLAQRLDGGDGPFDETGDHRCNPAMSPTRPIDPWWKTHSERTGRVTPRCSSRD